MRILLTGAAGFIGRHVAAACVAAGHEVIGVDALLPAVHPNRAAPDIPGVRWIAADVTDPVAMAAAMTDIDVVCHQAAMVGLGLDMGDAPDYARHNVLGTAVLLAAMAAAGVRRLVLASSMVIYGEGAYVNARGQLVRPAARAEADLRAGRFEPLCAETGAALRPALVSEDALADPRNVYATTKLGQEHLAANWARVSGGVVAALRYHNVYGPHMPKDTPYSGVAAIFRSALANGRPPQVFEDGAQRRDFIHVTDVASANLAALGWTAADGSEPFRAFNVGSGDVHTIGELADGLSRAACGPRPVVTGQYRLGDVRHITASSQRLRSELGWSPQVSFADGLAEFAQAPLRG